MAELDGSVSEESAYRHRRRVCDLGFLREAYRKADGTLGYRCAAEPEKAYLAKGGDPADLAGRKCLCNGLVANIGMPQRLADGSQELPLVTLGDDFENVGRFCGADPSDYAAEDVIRTLLG